MAKSSVVEERRRNERVIAAILKDSGGVPTHMSVRKTSDALRGFAEQRRQHYLSSHELLDMAADQLAWLWARQPGTRSLDYYVKTEFPELDPEQWKRIVKFVKAWLKGEVQYYAPTTEGIEGGERAAGDSGG